jgi:phage-related minor tail protein
MLDRIYQKLVISPLMNIFDQLLLTNSLLQLRRQQRSSNFGGTNVSGGTRSALEAAAAGLFNVDLWRHIVHRRLMLAAACSGRVGSCRSTRGDLFNTPTRFAMGGGAQGIAGEGPGLYEAIMPLKRGSDGRLGVAAQSGGGNREAARRGDHQRSPRQQRGSGRGAGARDWQRPPQARDHALRRAARATSIPDG